MVLFDVLAWSLLLVDRLERLFGLKDAVGDALEVLQVSFEDIPKEWVEERL